MNKMDLSRQERLDGAIGLTGEILGAQDGSIDALHHILKMSQRALLACYHRLPVPLVHIERVEVIQLLVCTNGVHVGIDTVARLNVIFGQGQAFPFCQRVYHLCLCIAQILYGERHGALHAVEVIVYAETFQHKQGSCDAAQPQFG